MLPACACSRRNPGVARFTCLARVMTILGVIDKPSPSNDAGDIVLGLSKITYSLASDSKVFDVFWSAAGQVQAAWLSAIAPTHDFSSCSDAVRDVVKLFGKAFQGFGVESDGYLTDFSVRKVCLAELAWKHRPVKWARVSLRELMEVSADQGEHLKHFPDDATASALSHFFFARHDWGLLVSCFACLWGEVADKEEALRPLDSMCSIVASADFANFVDDRRKVLGIAVAPYVAVRDYCRSRFPDPAKLKAEQKRAAKNATVNSSLPKRRRGAANV
jgi:hypothetical protein